MYIAYVKSFYSLFSNWTCDRQTTLRSLPSLSPGIGRTERPQANSASGAVCDFYILSAGSKQLTEIKQDKDTVCRIVPTNVAHPSIATPGFMCATTFVLVLALRDSQMPSIVLQHHPGCSSLVSTLRPTAKPNQKQNHTTPATLTAWGCIPMPTPSDW